MEVLVNHEFIFFGQIEKNMNDACGCTEQELNVQD